MGVWELCRQWGPGAKPLVGGLGRSPQKLATLFVKRCYFEPVLRCIHDCMNQCNMKWKKNHFGGINVETIRPAQYKFRRQWSCLMSIVKRKVEFQLSAAASKIIQHFAANDVVEIIVEYYQRDNAYCIHCTHIAFTIKKNYHRIVDLGTLRRPIWVCP